MSIVGDDIACASGTSPASEYKLDSLCLFIVFLVSSYIFNMNINNHYDVIILLNNIMIYFMAFGIKIYHKIPKILKIKTLIVVIGLGSLVLLLCLSQMLLMDQITNGGIIG
jgi:hypothetical protein